jgi:hypothetical protein
MIAYGHEKQHFTTCHDRQICGSEYPAHYYEVMADNLDNQERVCRYQVSSEMRRPQEALH